MKQFDFDKEAFEDHVPFHNYFVKRRASFIRKNIPKGLKCLDIGCGSGETALLINNHFKEFVGIDPAPKQIEVAKTRNLRNCSFMVGSSTNLKFSDNSFDIITIINVMHHLKSKDYLTTLKEAYRVLRENGQLIIYEHNPLNILIWIRFYHFSTIDKGANMINPFKMKKMCKDVGFKKTKLGVLFSEGLAEYYVAAVK